jgi:hypothetical protein
MRSTSRPRILLGAGIVLVMAFAVAMESSVWAVDEPQLQTPVQTSATPSDLVTDQIEPGVTRIVHDSFRDLTGAGSTRPGTHGQYLHTHVDRGMITTDSPAVAAGFAAALS